MHQWLISLMMSLWNPEQIIAMAHAAQGDQAEISLDSNPRFWPQNLTVVLRVLEIIVGVMFSHLPAGAMNGARGVEGDLFFYLRCSTHQIRVYFGHSSGSPEALRQIFFYLTLFFWVVKLGVNNIMA